jgi:hypothetical protein
MSFHRTIALTGLSLASVLACTSAHSAVVISKLPTQNMTCSGGVCSPTGPDAVLNVDDLAGMLAASDIKVVSDSSAVDIEVAAALSWASANRLTLDSYHSIAFEKPVTVAGPGGLTLTVNDGGTGGDFSFVKKGRIEFWDLHSSLVIGGNSYRLMKNIQQLAKAIAKKPSAFYALAKNNNAGKDGTYAHSPIPTTFMGIFEGLGNTISNLSIDDEVNEPYIGLFARTSGATLRDVRLTDAVVLAPQASGQPSDVGSLVGQQSGGQIIGVDVVATVSAPMAVAVGGLAGGATSVRNSSSAGSVTGGGVVGGLTGGGGISYSHSSANVSATATNGTAGGLTGSAGGVQYSYATGTVNGNAVAGGLIGDNESTVTKSFATGSVVGGASSLVGGLIGLQNGFVIDCYATGSATAGANTGLMPMVGGLVGLNGNLIAESYSTGLVTGQADSFIGGFIGYDQTPFYNSVDYWDTETSGQSQATGTGNETAVTGLTTAQFKSGLPSGFETAVWAEKRKINDGYPYLLDNPPPK